MRYIEDLKENLCRELEEYGQKENLSTSDLERVDTLAHAAKNLDKILMCEEGEYSQSGDWYAVGRYDDGTSYRGRKRDSMGRYSRNDAQTRHNRETAPHGQRCARQPHPGSTGKGYEGYGGLIC